MVIVFWQRMFSPHMLGLADALVELGHRVIFVAQEELSQERRKQGWSVPIPGAAERILIGDLYTARTFIANLPSNTVHIVQGIRGNADIERYQNLILAVNHRLWIIMETVDDRGWRGGAKRLIYRYLLRRKRRDIEGIFAIGANTAGWLAARGFPTKQIFPFAYFISPPQIPEMDASTEVERPFTFTFVGNLEPWKNPAMALEAFLGLSTGRRRLLFVGDGSQRASLERRSKDRPTEAEIEFLGRVSMGDVPSKLLQTDCLILPSNVDGWGVVASEAMLLGTPVIASDACGVHEAVSASPSGAVFPAGSLAKLTDAMNHMQGSGKDKIRRRSLSAWAYPLSAEFGAHYLESVLYGVSPDNLPDWLRGKRG